MLTGCRLTEALTLCWEDVAPDAGELRLRDAKTWPRAVPLSPPAAKILADLERVPGNSWVFPGKSPGACLTSVDARWHRLRARAGLLRMSGFMTCPIRSLLGRWRLARVCR